MVCHRRKASQKTTLRILPPAWITPDAGPEIPAASSYCFEKFVDAILWVDEYNLLAFQGLISQDESENEQELDVEQDR